MSSFTTRIELHSSVYVDFESLHRFMQSEGFSRQITSDNGVAYHLPRAEYNILGNITRDEVLSRAKRAVRYTGKTAEILVTESAGRTWDNLTKVG